MIIENNKLVSVKLDDESVVDTDGLFISIGSVPSADIFDVEKIRNLVPTYDDIYFWAMAVANGTKIGLVKNKDLNLKDYLDEISRRAKPYLEKMIEYMNPYVIVSDNDYFEVLKQTYGISNGEIEINNNIYPIYNIDDINEYKEEIIQLANQEYRGIYYPMVISQEEMQELEKENIAIKIKD